MSEYIYFSKIREEDNMPTRAMIFFGILCVSFASIFDMRLFIELAALMNLVSNTLICGGILILRYSHQIHEKYHQKLKENEVDNAQSFKYKRRVFK